MIKSYKDLEVYEQAYNLAIKVHHCSQDFPQIETYELGSQLRRAATSIPLNIAEGYGKKRFTAEFKRFLVSALGSCNEVAVLLNMCRDLDYISDEIFCELSSSYDILGKSLNKLIQNWN